MTFQQGKNLFNKKRLETYNWSRSPGGGGDKNKPWSDIKESDEKSTYSSSA